MICLLLTFSVEPFNFNASITSILSFRNRGVTRKAFSLKYFREPIVLVFPFVSYNFSSLLLQSIYNVLGNLDYVFIVIMRRIFVFVYDGGLDLSSYFISYKNVKDWCCCAATWWFNLSRNFGNNPSPNDVPHNFSVLKCHVVDITVFLRSLFIIKASANFCFPSFFCS